MKRRVVSGLAVVAMLLGTTPAFAATTTPTGDTITATGTGQTRVFPKNRHSNASIIAAVERAHRAAIAGALRQAHEYAGLYAKAVGLTLGSVVSVSDAQNGFYGPGPFGFGPFGVNQYCGTIQRPVGRAVKGKPRKFKKVHRCIVPRFAYATLTVTYSATS
jgi:uncharacterized protein YggE